MSSNDIMGWMIYDKTQDKDFIDAYNREVELTRINKLSDEERDNEIRRMLGGAK